MSLQKYQTLVALNNKGVSLLEKGCLVDAMESFIEALELLKNYCSFETETKEHSKLDTNDDALRLLCRPPRVTTATETSRIHDNIVAISDDMQEQVLSCPQLFAEKQPIFAVRITHFERLSDSEKGDPRDANFNVDVATILLNYAVACVCPWETFRTCPFDEQIEFEAKVLQLYGSVEQLLRTEFEAIIASLDDDDDDADDNDLLDLMNITFLLVLVSTNISSFFFLINEPLQGKCFSSKAKYFIKQFSAVKKEVPDYIVDASTRPAAAA